MINRMVNHSLSAMNANAVNSDEEPIDPGQIDSIFFALAHSTRRAILQRLRHGSATVSELAAQFTISSPAISKHLRVLERAGLLVQEKEGRTRHCHLASKPLGDAAAWLDEYRQFWEERFDALDEFLSEPKQESSISGASSPSEGDQT